MTTALRQARAASSNIETLRVLAVILLVSYHAIGGGPETGLGLDHGHPLRVFADAFGDLRMPLFAFVSGFVYALRPATRGGFGAFLVGKTQRLIVPGVIAALIFWGVATHLVPGSVGAGVPLGDVLALDYVHFWFLQAIFVILVAIALAEAAAGRALGPMVLAPVAVALAALPREAVPTPSLAGVVYLAPYFLMGVGVSRARDLLSAHRGAVATVAAAALVAGLVLSGLILAETGRISVERRDLQSVLVAIGAITLLWLYMPRVARLHGFGAAAFTVYLYHVFGTSGMRRAAELAGIDNVWIVFGLSAAAGLALPFGLHLAVARLKDGLAGAPRRPAPAAAGPRKIPVRGAKNPLQGSSQAARRAV